jgi:Xaa-Pro aminopeptidase
MLSGQELSWLNAYHARVRHEVRPHVDEATRLWLDAATAPLSL